MNALPDKPDLGPDGPAATARLTQDTRIRGTTTVARTVASEPLDAYSVSSHLSDRLYEAGCILRRALHHSWRQPRVTSGMQYVSDPSDDDGVQLTEEERAERIFKAQQTCISAARIVGTLNWPTVRGVCGDGKWATTFGGMKMLQAGLRMLADEWKVVD